MNKKVNNLSTSPSSSEQKKLAEDILRTPLPYSNSLLPAFTHSLPNRVFMFSQKQGFEHKSPSCHERFVLVFMLQGSSQALLDGKMLDMPQDSAMLIFPYQFHHFVNTDIPGLSWLLITFECDDADYLLQLQNRSIKFSQSCLSELAIMLEDFRDTTLPDQNKSPILSSRLQVVLYSLLADTQPKPAQSPKKVLPNQHMYEVIRRVAEKVTQNISGSYTVSDAAEDVGISVSYLQKIFQQVLGIGAGLYIRRNKIFHAARLLKSTNMTISEIADQCGFDSLYSFSRSFKSIIKSSPREFRNNPASRLGNWYS